MFMKLFQNLKLPCSNIHILDTVVHLKLFDSVVTELSVSHDILYIIRVWTTEINKDERNYPALLHCTQMKLKYPGYKHYVYTLNNL